MWLDIRRYPRVYIDPRGGIRKIIARHKGNFSWRTNRRSRRKSNFHRGNGNLGIDIGGIRRIVTRSSEPLEREDIRRWLPEERAIKVEWGT